MNRAARTVALAASIGVLASCGSDAAESTQVEEAAAPSLSTENAGSDFCVTFAALDSSSVFLHAGEDTIRPGLELQIERIEELASSLPDELSGDEAAWRTQLAASKATLGIYAANGFDADRVSDDPSFNDVSQVIAASLQADAVNATRAVRTYCGIQR